jgi:hypothetical protein
VAEYSSHVGQAIVQNGKVGDDEVRKDNVEDLGSERQPWCLGGDDPVAGCGPSTRPLRSGEVKLREAFRSAASAAVDPPAPGGGRALLSLC